MGVQTFWSEFWQGIQAGIVEKLNTVRRVRGLPPVKHRNCTPRTTPKSMKYCHGRTVNKNPRVMERVMECRLDKSHEKWTSWVGLDLAGPRPPAPPEDSSVGLRPLTVAYKR
jgi:hypothetical protein